MGVGAGGCEPGPTSIAVPGTGCRSPGTRPGGGCVGRRRPYSSEALANRRTPRLTSQGERPGLHRFKVTGWVDAFSTWRSELVRRLAAGEDLTVELQVGAGLVASAAKRAGGEDRDRLKAWAARMRDATSAEHAELATAEELSALMDRWPDRARRRTGKV